MPNVLNNITCRKKKFGMGFSVDKHAQQSDSSTSFFSMLDDIAVIDAFTICRDHLSPIYYYDMPSLTSGDELVMLVMRSDPRCSDKLVHGMVAFVSSLGFEMLKGSICSEFGRVSLANNSFRYDDESTSTRLRLGNYQLFTAYFKRQISKSPVITHKPFSLLRMEIQLRLSQMVRARSMDWNCSLCSEDLAGIKEFRLLDNDDDSLIVSSNDWPIIDYDLRSNLRLFAQPLQGYGHRPIGQWPRKRVYKLVVVGVNQAGFFTFIHCMLIIAGFRVVEALIETVRGSYATNTYIIETFSKGAEGLLRTNFQCVVPLRSPEIEHDLCPLIRSVDACVGTENTPHGVWFENDLNSAFFGKFVNQKRVGGFGRYWKSLDSATLTSWTYEGDWDDDCATGFGFQLSDEAGVVGYKFGRFVDEKLIDGCILCPFEPPAKSLRVDSLQSPPLCVYRVLIQRSEYWRRQLPKNERPFSFLPATRLCGENAALSRHMWTQFAESPVPAIATMNVCQLAAFLEISALPKNVVEKAFSLRIDGKLLEAMNTTDLREILSLSESMANMLIQLASTMCKAHNVDRHMRQPASVLDALANPSISGKVFPLAKMRVVDHLGEGAYGKVVYAEYQDACGQEPATAAPRPKTSYPSRAAHLPKTANVYQPFRRNSATALHKSSSVGNMRDIPRVSSANVLRFWGNGDTSGGASDSNKTSTDLTKQHHNMYVALKEQVGSGILLENACELVREWATLNALPHENIVRLEGICADTDAPVFNKRYLATALIEASLPSLIYANDAFGPAPKLTPLLTIQLAGDVASGLAHMHSLHILHGDIKSPNILVDIRTRDRPVARICDFGHAAIRIGPRPQRRMCTFGWASPESLRDGETDCKSDVWSWAVVVWEMYVGEIPWKARSHPQMLAAVGYCGLNPGAHTDNHIPTRVLAECKISKLTLACWQMNPKVRPSMNRILRIVDKLGRITATRVVENMQALLQ